MRGPARKPIAGISQGERDRFEAMRFYYRQRGHELTPDEFHARTRAGKPRTPKRAHRKREAPRQMAERLLREKGLAPKGTP